LMYHRVVAPLKRDGTYIQPGMYVTSVSFTMQMRYLKKRYNVIPLAEMIGSLRNGCIIQSNTCVITFDDGWRDTYDHAFPILKKYDLPATVFIVSDYVGTDRWFWPDKLSYLLTKYLASEEHKKPPSIIAQTLERSGILKMLSSAELSPGEKIDMVIERMKHLPAERNKVLFDLELFLYDTEEATDRQMLSWNEVDEMCRSKVTFGSHTKSHAILTEISKDEVAREVVESQVAIEEHLSTPCSTFCYPNGDFNNEIQEIVRSHYDCAVTTQKGTVKLGDDLSALKRVGIHDDITYTKALFACRISGILAALGL
jgi:peptidoglycan/xylan/chitin deacetylase (PgdA/CDA1 family)